MQSRADNCQNMKFVMESIKTDAKSALTKLNKDVKPTKMWEFFQAQELRAAIENVTELLSARQCLFVNTVVMLCATLCVPTFNRKSLDVLRMYIQFGNWAIADRINDTIVVRGCHVNVWNSLQTEHACVYVGDFRDLEAAIIKGDLVATIWQKRNKKESLWRVDVIVYFILLYKSCPQSGLKSRHCGDTGCSDFVGTEGQLEAVKVLIVLDSRKPGHGFCGHSSGTTDGHIWQSCFHFHSSTGERLVRPVILSAVYVADVVAKWKPSMIVLLSGVSEAAFWMAL